MDEYIKMVLALDPKFFEDWEFNDGDNFWLTDDTDEWYLPSNECKEYTILDSKLVSNVVDPEDWIFASLDIGRHIPSQKQLQDVIMEKIGWSPKALLEMFMFWAQTGIQRDDFWQFDSWDEGWLQFFMFVIDGKSWNGDLWV